MPSKIEKKEHHTEEKPSTTVKISVEKKEENTISQKQVHQKPKEDLFLPSLFGRWSTQEVKIHDYSLAPYINLESRFVLHSFGRNAKQPFGKAKLNIVERLINKIMRAGQGKRKMSGKFIRGRHGTGRKIQAMQIVENAFERIEHETKQNPLQILIDAIEHATVREDTTRIKRGGVAYSVSVDVAPMKRVDEAIKNLALSGFAGSFKKKTPAHEALAREIILAAKGDNASFSIKRRDEVERIAMASR
ncbi:30S ribosomal protein S7 [Candidatus Micrarchaeota archaeon]|nr:30S ribosomal protein S7 [Candidatus Micrarchaeota archaeon]MBU1930724.1 30S ribosomal protein S7 [Candidatus Micrarchaeota archaeon]